MIEDVEHVRIEREALQQFVRALIGRAGADTAGADAVTRAVMEASGRGVDTHGVRLVPHYVKTVAGGRINGAARPRFHQAGSAARPLPPPNAFWHLHTHPP